MQRGRDMAPEQCDVCDAIATVEYAVTTDGSTRRYCCQHEPARIIGAQSVDLKLVRSRLPPNNYISKHLNCAVDSPEHRSLRIDLCQSKLLGDEGACRYYLSRLNGVDYFVAWNDEFLRAIREFAVRQYGDAATRCCYDLGASSILVGLMRRAFELRFGDSPARKKSKEEIAVELLLVHPEWPDERIAQEVGTTTKQLHRFSIYSYARVIERRSPSR